MLCIFVMQKKTGRGVVTAIILFKLGYEKQYIINDYLLSAANLESELQLFVDNNPDVDINVIIPKAEYIEGFLDWYQTILFAPKNP